MKNEKEKDGSSAARNAYGRSFFLSGAFERPLKDRCIGSLDSHFGSTA